MFGALGQIEPEANRQMKAASDKMVKSTITPQQSAGSTVKNTSEDVTGDSDISLVISEAKETTITMCGKQCSNPNCGARYSAAGQCAAECGLNAL